MKPNAVKGIVVFGFSLLFLWALLRRQRSSSLIDGLLAEYQAGHQRFDTISSSMWQFTSILIGAAIAGAAILVTHQPTSRREGIAIFVLGLVICCLIVLWYMLWRRHSVALEINYRRMREIEQVMNLRLNIYNDILRQWSSRRELTSWRGLSPTEKTVLEGYRTYPSPSGNVIIFIVGLVVALGWMAIAIWKLGTAYGLLTFVGP